MDRCYAVFLPHINERRDPNLEHRYATIGPGRLEPIPFPRQVTRGDIDVVPQGSVSHSVVFVIVGDRDKCEISTRLR